MVIKSIHIISGIFSGFFLVGKACDGRSRLLAHTVFRTGAFYAENNQSKEKKKTKEISPYMVFFRSGIF